MNTVNVQFPYTENEAVKSMMEMAKELGFRFRLYSVFGIFLMVMGIAFLVINGVNQGVLFTTAIGAFLALTPLLLRVFAKANFTKLPNANQVVFWTFTNEGFECRSPGAQMSSAWRLLLRVKETPNGFLLFFQPKMAYWIPKHAFQSESDITRFLEFVESSPVKLNRL